MQIVQLQRELGNLPEALKYCKEAIEKFPTFHKLHLILSQLYVDIGDFNEARAVFDKAFQIDALKGNKLIWLSYAKLESDQENYTRARTILQKARVKMSQDEDIWLASVRLEIKSENLKIA